MKKVIAGFAFHVHHDSLVEWCTDYDKRVEYIRGYKPQHERALRLKLFKLIPIERLPIELGKVGEAYTKVREAYDRAEEAHDKAVEACTKAVEGCTKAEEAHIEASRVYNEARETHVEALRVYDKARETYSKAWRAYDKTLGAHGKELGILHQELCPNCPWDGKTIFAKAE